MQHHEAEELWFYWPLGGLVEMKQSLKKGPVEGVSLYNFQVF